MASPARFAAANAYLSGVRAEHLYVHIPFCARRCVYCDFSIAVRAKVPAIEYVRCLRAELATRHAESGFDLASIYLGGGTPSRLPSSDIARLLAMLLQRASTGDGVEITIEANPDDVTADAARDWKASGINRVSLGVQSFDQHVLSWMHRTHTAGQSERAVAILRDAGIRNISIDLIFALPPELGRSWADDLDRALALDVPHLSIYGLTVETRTPLGRWVARNQVLEAPEELFEREFLVAASLLSAAGYDHYEVSNYALPGYRSVHNSGYWLRRPYAGLGPSAHEFDGLNRRWMVSAYADWVERLSSGRTVIAGEERLDAEQARAEEVYLGLRTSKGVSISSAETEIVSPWLDAGWASLSERGELRLTPYGWLRLDALATDLTTVRSC